MTRAEVEDIIDLNERKAKNVPVINYLRGGPVVDLWPGWLESNYRLNFHFIKLSVENFI